MMLAAATAGLLGSAVAAVALRRTPRRAARVFALFLGAGAVAGTWAALRLLLTEAPGQHFTAGGWSFGLDPLSAWFLLLVLGVGALAGLFGTEYLAGERPAGAAGRTHALFALLLLGMMGVVLARAVVPFLAAWEVMALSAYLLVMHDSRDSNVRHAGLIYLILTHLSTLALIGMFAALAAPAADGSFLALAAANSVASPSRTTALALGLLGFGLKAGAVPLHFWLPGAHAAAPSHVSAVLSGVMLKMGIYGLFRILLITGGAPPWWGWVTLGIGLASGVLGVVWALAQHDLKRLLAYHSVENVGIILLGLGLGALGAAYGAPVVTVVGFGGALLHSLNHALFKSLLFLGAGAIQRGTGTRDIDRLGGLGRQMPSTALAFAIGSAAIVGLPPFNGFVSEWLVFRGLWQAGLSPSALRYAVLGAAGLALVGGLALACFAKLDGILLLGQPRRGLAGRDPGGAMRWPMWLLAGGCLLVGLAPSLLFRPLAAVVVTLPGAADNPGVHAALGPAWPLTVVGVVVLGVIGCLAAWRRWAGAGGGTLIAGTWGCAAPALTPRMQYTASSFAAPLMGSFAPWGGARAAWEGSTFHTRVADPVQDDAILPLWRWLTETSRRLRDRHGGRLRWYLIWVVLTLVALLFDLLPPGWAR